MKNILQCIKVFVSIFVLFLYSAVVPLTHIYAAEPTTSKNITAASITSYVYSAKAGDSLSKIVRRSLQLRAVTDQPVTMFCENTIATLLGNEFIEVDQQVTVTYQQIDNCIATASSLTLEQRASWQSYADNVIFDVNDISPINNSATVVAPQSSTQTQSTPTPALNTPSPKKSSDDHKVEKNNFHTNKKPFNKNWYAAIAGLIIILFLTKGSLYAKTRQ